MKLFYVILSFSVFSNNLFDSFLDVKPFIKPIEYYSFYTAYDKVTHEKVFIKKGSSSLGKRLVREEYEKGKRLEVLIKSLNTQDPVKNSFCFPLSFNTEESYIVFPYFDGKSYGTNGYEHSQVINKKVIEILAFFAANNIEHGDFHGENILISNTDNITVIDFQTLRFDKPFSDFWTIENDVYNFILVANYFDTILESHFDKAYSRYKEIREAKE